jgi:hypothetical protein
MQHSLALWSMTKYLRVARDRFLPGIGFRSIIPVLKSDGGSMAVTTQIRSVHSNRNSQLTQQLEKESVVSRLTGRVIQITLALYLLPALLAVLAVGGVGISILKFCQLFSRLIQTSVD